MKWLQGWLMIIGLCLSNAIFADCTPIAGYCRGVNNQTEHNWNVKFEGCSPLSSDSDFSITFGQTDSKWVIDGTSTCWVIATWFDPRWNVPLAKIKVRAPVKAGSHVLSDNPQDSSYTAHLYSMHTNQGSQRAMCVRVKNTNLLAVALDALLGESEGNVVCIDKDILNHSKDGDVFTESNLG